MKRPSQHRQRIISALELRLEARSAREIAIEAKVSSRCARMHLRELTKEGKVYMTPAFPAYLYYVYQVVGK